MTSIAVLTVILILVILYRLFLAPDSSSRHIVQMPDYERERLHKVDYDSSLQYLLFRNSSPEQLKNKIIEYSQLTPGDKDQKEHTFKLCEVHDWIVFPLSGGVDYFLFVQLFGWLSDSPITDIMETNSLAYVQSKNTTENSFYLFYDSSHMDGGTFVGRVDSGQKFYIYMPDWLPENEHLHEKVILKEDIDLPDFNTTDLLREIGFEVNWLEETDMNILEEVIVEIG